MGKEFEVFELNEIQRLAFDKDDKNIYRYFVKFCYRKGVLPVWNSDIFAKSTRQILAKLIELADKDFCVTYSNMIELLYKLQTNKSRTSIQRYLERAKDTKTINWHSLQKIIELTFCKQVLNVYPDWYSDQLIYMQQKAFNHLNQQVAANV